MPGYRNKRGPRKGKGKNSWGWDSSPAAKVDIPGIVKGKCVDCGKLIQPGASRCSCKLEEPRTPESTSSSMSCVKEKESYVLLMESLGSVVSASGSDTSSVCSVGELSKSSISSLPKSPRSKLQGLLNRLSADRYTENYLKIKDIIFTEDICLTDVASLLLNHVMNTHHAQELYARLACDLSVAIAGPTQSMLQSPFRRDLLGLLQQNFQMLLQHIEDGRHLRSLLTFIASLYKVAMVGTQTIHKIIDSMLKEAELRPLPNSLELELGMHLLKNVSEQMAMKPQFREYLTTSYERIEVLSCALCPRLRFFWEELSVQRDRDLYSLAKADSCPIPATSPCILSDEDGVPPPRYLTF